MQIGERIKQRRLLRGWSIRHAADRAGISHASWSRIERGLQAADNRFVLAGIAAALGCAGEDLAEARLSAADRRLAAAHAGIPALRQALVDAELPVPGRSTARPDERRLRLIVGLRHSCDFAGAIALLPDLISDLHTATAGPDPATALRMLCGATWTASAVLLSMGFPSEGWLAAERCRDAAQAADDPVLLGCAAFARACAALDCGSTARGLAIATDGVRELSAHLATRRGVVTAGVLHLTGAYAACCLSRRGESRSWTAEATGLARHTGEAIAHGLYFGPANVDLWRVRIELAGGDAGRALEIAAGMNVSALPHPDRLVWFHTDVASASAQVSGGEPNAVRHLLTAERIAPQHVHASPVVRETTRALLGRPHRNAAGSALRGLGERMQIAG